MATFTDRLLMLIESKVAGQADVQKAASNMQGAAQAAEGTTQATGRLGKAWDLLKGSGALAGIGIGTVAKVAFDSLKKFEDLAKTSLDLGEALGVTTDEASRWIAVADDYQVSATDIGKALLSVEKSAAKGGAAIEAAGGQIKRAQDGTVDVSATMESVADGLRGIQDPAQRAAAGAAIFGKNWANVAPIMSKSGAAIDKAMKSVSDGQVITEDEAAKAEEMRLAQDRLSDALGDLERMLGGVLASFAPLIDLVAQGVEWYGKLTGALDHFTDRLGPAGLVVKAFTSPMGLLGEVVSKVTGKHKDHKDAVDKDAAATRILGEEADTSTDRMNAMNDALDAAMGKLDVESKARDVAKAFKELGDKAWAAGALAAKGSKDAAAAADDYQGQLIDTKKGVLDYVKAIGGIPPAKLTEILALVDQGKYREAQLQLAALSKTREMTVKVQTDLSALNAWWPKFKASAGATAASGAPMGPTPVPGSAGMVGVGGRATPTLTVQAQAAPVIVIHSPMIGNPAHVSDAIMAGYRRAIRLNGARQVLPEQVPA